MLVNRSRTGAGHRSGGFGAVRMIVVTVACGAITVADEVHNFRLFDNREPGEQAYDLQPSRSLGRAGG
ncbi:hypothetical protein MMAN_20960 [Mycobacterium mantenii]|uniref:Uncharacterized protein n=1 Tax=Mycobacterium mantenii TaxID=560555 RepID=A0ABM7JSG8_MYCNT|nr:hypothetical protein MMAN_20960 [Mycobacterium mantenii]